MEQRQTPHCCFLKGSPWGDRQCREGDLSRLTVNSLVSPFLSEWHPQQGQPTERSIGQAAETGTEHLRPACITHLGSDVVWSAAEGLGSHPVPDVLLAHAKVGDLYVPLAIQHHVVQL